MEHVGLFTRKKITAEIEKGVQESEACIFLGFNKVNAASLNIVRNSLKDSGSRMVVSKNTLIKRSLESLGKKDFSGLLKGETGIVFVYENDITKACKVLSDFSKDNDNLKIKGGFIKDKTITDKDVKNLAALPPKDVLLSLVVGGLAAPLTGFLAVLNQVTLKFLWAVEEIKRKKEE